MKIKNAQERTVDAVKLRLRNLGVKRMVDILLMQITEEFGELVRQMMNEKLKKKNIDVEVFGKPHFEHPNPRELLRFLGVLNNTQGLFDMENVGEEIADCFLDGRIIGVKRK